MRIFTAIVTIVVLVLWLISATYLAAPSSVQSMLPQPLMGNVPPAFLGVITFLLSIVVIAIWAALTSDNPPAPKEVAAAQPTK